jgi:hypothetical protein
MMEARQAKHREGEPMLISPPKTFLTLCQIAYRLGIPEAWLKAEAESGRIPCIRIGRRMLFHPDVVERSLMDRATENCRSAVPALETATSP